jgi:hypothetical protein
MKRFILIFLLLLPCILFSQSRKSFQLSPTYFYCNSVVFDENSSFTDFRNESKLFNRSTSYGLSGLFFKRDRFSYYQSRQYGLKISILKSTSSQKIVYDPTPGSNFKDIYTTNTTYSFIEVPLLFTQASTNHQTFIYEIGPVYSYYLNERSSKIGLMVKAGIHNHISDRLTYSFLFSSNGTRLGQKYYRLVNGFELNIIYRISKR